MAFDFRYPNASADERGWGDGWKTGMPIGARPASYRGKVVPLVVDLTEQGQGRLSFIGDVREEVHDLLEMLVSECAARGYTYQPECYGGAFRPTKRSGGGDPDVTPGLPGSLYTSTASNHSWYIAVDLSTTKNVYGGSTHDIPDWMVDLFHRYGWRWLGNTEIHDWEHFDFAGTPADAAAMTEKARKDGIGMALTEEQEQTLKAAKVFLDELRDRLGQRGNESEEARAKGAGDRVAKAVLTVERKA